MVNLFSSFQSYEIKQFKLVIRKKVETKDYFIDIFYEDFLEVEVVGSLGRVQVGL